MKILIAIPYVADVYGGPSKVVQELAHSLGQKGISIDLITTNANGTSNLAVPTDQWIEEDGYRIQYFGCLHRYDSIWSASLVRWLAKHAASYTVVHTHNMFAPTMSVARWICRKKCVPYVTTPHGMLEPWALSYKASKKRLYYQQFEVPTLKTASAIHVLNALEKSHVNTLGFDKTVVIPNGIHLQDFRKPRSPDLFYQHFPHTQGKKIVLFLGRIDPKKGLDLLAPAFGKAHQEFPNTHLVLAGPDSIDFLPIAQSYFTKASCTESVTFTGMLTGDLKYAALAAASIYVAPSYSEGFSMSVLEGMATGLPCIITNECNFPEAAAAKAAEVVPLNSQAIFTALHQILEHPRQAKEMGQRAQNLVFKDYSWSSAADKLIKLYTQVSAAFALLNTQAP